MGDEDSDGSFFDDDDNWEWLYLKSRLTALSQGVSKHENL